ncbi:MAG: PIN domain-containing protein [Armatimonadetes bacterium]|nr:PIN domain-containing protein [Armatimonadota bacterium]
MAEAAQPRHVIDTSLLIDAFRRRPLAVDFLSELDSHSLLCVSDVALMEILVGCRDRRELVATQRWLANFEAVPVNEAISRRAVELVAEYGLSHHLEAADALIAATALEHACPLCTLNDRHFAMIDGLTVHRPY